MNGSRPVPAASAGENAPAEVDLARIQAERDTSQRDTSQRDTSQRGQEPINRQSRIASRVGDASAEVLSPLFGE